MIGFIFVNFTGAGTRTGPRPVVLINRLPAALADCNPTRVARSAVIVGPLASLPAYVIAAAGHSGVHCYIIRCCNSSWVCCCWEVTTLFAALDPHHICLRFSCMQMFGFPVHQTLRLVWEPFLDCPPCIIVWLTRQYISPYGWKWHSRLSSSVPLPPSPFTHIAFPAMLWLTSFYDLTCLLGLIESSSLQEVKQPNWRTNGRNDFTIPQKARLVKAKTK